jgi:hypothetical protein
MKSLLATLILALTACEFTWHDHGFDSRVVDIQEHMVLSDSVSFKYRCHADTLIIYLLDSSRYGYELDYTHEMSALSAFNVFRSDSSISLIPFFIDRTNADDTVFVFIRSKDLNAMTNRYSEKYVDILLRLNAETNSHMSILYPIVLEGINSLHVNERDKYPGSYLDLIWNRIHCKEGKTYFSSLFKTYLYFCTYPDYQLRMLKTFNYIAEEVEC